MTQRIRFSGRIHWELEENDLARALAKKKAEGAALFDLTSSNPTLAGIPYETDAILDSLRKESVLRYDPDPRGSLFAREAVSAYYLGRGARVAPDDLFLAASTSEAYGFLFKLLCDPGDEVLVPRPSYPLFDFLAALEGVKPVSYALRYDGSWHLDFPSLEEAIGDRARMVVAVHPNNPTGSYLSAGDRSRLLDLCRRHGLPLVIDEVFLDYPLAESAAPESFAGTGHGLRFVLSGLSKLAGLPQMKLGWIAIAGDEAVKREASLRLEHIADSYLSVGAPVLSAAKDLLAIGERTRPLIAERTRANLDALTRAVGRLPALTLLRPEGGWYAALRLPALATAEQWATALLAEESVYVHPGGFFGFDLDSVIVLSLLPPLDRFEEGVARMLRLVGNRLDSRDG